MVDPPPVIWADIFRKRSHTFTEKEMLDANYSDLAPLSQHCPEFWDAYETGEKNPKKLQDLWDLEWEWTQAVRDQNFPEAKRIFNILKKVKLKDFK